MARVHEDYIPPVGFAREPQAERSRWIGRIALLLFVIAIVTLAYFRVVRTPENIDVGPVGESTLPDPV